MASGPPTPIVSRASRPKSVILPDHVLLQDVELATAPSIDQLELHLGPAPQEDDELKEVVEDADGSTEGLTLEAFLGVVETIPDEVWTPHPHVFDDPSSKLPSKKRGTLHTAPDESLRTSKRRLQSQHVVRKRSKMAGLKAIKHDQNPFERKARSDTVMLADTDSSDDDTEVVAPTEGSNSSTPNTRTTEQSKSGSEKRSWVQRRLKKSPLEKATRRLEKFAKKLAVFIARQGQKLDDLKELSRSMLLDAGAEIRQLRDTQCGELIPMYRDLTLLKLSRLRLEMRLKCFWGTAMSAHRDECLTMLVDLKSGDSKEADDVITFVNSNDPSFFFPSLSKHFSTHPRTMELNRLVTNVSNVARTVERTFLEKQSSIASSRLMNKQERSSALLALVEESIAKYDGGDYDVSEAQQTAFDCLFLDPKTSAGQVLQSWIRDINAHSETSDPIETADFVEDLTSDLRRIYLEGMNGAEVSTILHLLLSRMVYRRISPRLSLYFKELAGPLDVEYRARCRWLRGAHPSRFGVKAELLPEEPWSSPPYADACAILEDAAFIPVPTDALRIVVRTHHAIHEAAAGYLSSKASALAADDIFPIFVYVVVNSFFPAPWECVHFLTTFASERERISEMGYCLTTFEAALSHINAFIKEEWIAGKDGIPGH